MIAMRTRAYHTFDRSVIKTRWRKIAESPAKKAGLYVRRVAINSIRRDKSKHGNRPSKPGKPPRTRAPGDPLRRIYSVPEMLGARVIVGPLGLGAVRPVTELHEFGGVKTGFFRRRSTAVRASKRGKRLKPAILIERATVRFPKRPYMGPALLKSVPKLPPMWRGSFSN